jgi:hypothetical protein
MTELNIPTMDFVLKGCTCYTCGSASVETYAKERLGLDPKTLKPNFEYRKYQWQTINDPDAIEDYERAAWTKPDDIWGKKLIVNNGDSEEITEEEYKESRLQYRMNDALLNIIYD